jgi:hypothetical protein
MWGCMRACWNADYAFVPPLIEIMLQLMQVRQSLTQLLREITEAPAHILLQDLRPRGVILLQKRDHRRDICTLSAWLIKKAHRCGAA